MSLKAAFFDLDGTLAVNNRPPSKKVIDAVRAFREQDNLVFLCTGRATSYIYQSVLSIGFDGIVGAAGAYVSVGGRVLYKRLLPPNLVRRIIVYFLESGNRCILEGEQNMYAVNPCCPEDGTWPEISDPDAFEPGNGAFAGQGIYKFTAYGSVAEAVRRLVSDEMSVIDHKLFAEVLPAGCSKADGMRRVLEEVGISRENSIAFGDSRNDIDMLQYAGLGVAMGGSPEPVLRAADSITASITEDGVALTLNSLLKNQSL